MQLDADQISKCRSHVTRCLFLSQDRADITFAVNELYQNMSDPTQRSFAKLQRLVRYLKGEAMDPGFRIRGHEFRRDGFLGLRLGRRQRNEEIVKRGSRARGATPCESVHKKTENQCQKQSCMQQHWER